MSDTVLIVDDEVDLVDILEYSLQKEGYRTLRAHNGADGLRLAQRSPGPNLILLDLMLPDISGTEVCRALRARGETKLLPIIMLTARDDEIDRVVGFEVGTDDYVTKPFSVRELLLRVRALLRRRASDAPAQAPVLALGMLSIDPAAHRVTVGEEEVSLTALEFRLLQTLFERRGRVQSRDVLLRDVWGMRPGITTRTVDTHVTRLRRKLGEVGFWIETRRGVGYLMREQPTPIAGREPDPSRDLSA